MNENQEFEFINNKTRERAVDEEASCKQAADTFKAFVAEKRKKACMRMSVNGLVIVAAVFGTVGLAKIDWINDIFCAVLLCVEGLVLAFKAGYFWYEIKKFR